MSVAALVLAAGRGERLGANRAKAFVPLAGSALIVHTLAALAAADEVAWVVPVVAEDDLAEFAALADELASIPKLTQVVVGGAARQDSMAAGLAALPAGVTHVVVHDAARPLVRAAAVDRVVAAAKRHGAAILAVPVRDTIKRVQGGRITATPPRAECWAAQTPQVFAVELLREALAKARLDGRVGTDDAEIVEALGVEVVVIEGDPDNLKVTFAEDLCFAEQQLLARADAGAKR